MSKIYTNGLIDLEIAQPDPLCVNGRTSYYVGPHGYPRHQIAGLDDVGLALRISEFEEILDPLTAPGYLAWLDACNGR